MAETLKSPQCENQQYVSLKRHLKLNEKIVELKNSFAWGGGFHHTERNIGYTIAPDKFFNDGVIQFDRYISPTEYERTEQPDYSIDGQGKLLKQRYGEKFVSPVTEKVESETHLVGWRIGDEG